MTKYLSLLVIGFLFFPDTAAAQRNCKKGIPCGNSCISADKVCRIGQAPAPKPSAEPTAQTLTSRASSISAPTNGPWVASVDGTVYYRSECATAMKLSEDERIYFDTEIDAKIQGFKRSKARNC